MAIGDALLPGFDAEVASTRKTLKRRSPAPVTKT